MDINKKLKGIELNIESSAIVNQIFSRSKRIRDFHKLAAAKGERRRRSTGWKEMYQMHIKPACMHKFNGREPIHLLSYSLLLK